LTDRDVDFAAETERRGLARDVALELAPALAPDLERDLVRDLTAALFFFFIASPSPLFLDNS
jgi:hypothetical protein